jgi:biotin carboxylase
LGVQRITQWDELKDAVHRALDVSIICEAMVEEYIDGREISVEMISCRGIHYALQITDKVTTGAPHFVELEHHQPSDLPAAMQTHIFDITRRALDALGLTNGASHSEYKITNEGRIAVMEIGGRMGGDFIGSDLVRLSTGYDFVEGVIRVALGEIIHPEPKQIGRSSVIFDAPENVSCSGERTGYRIYQNSKLVESL